MFKKLDIQKIGVSFEYSHDIFQTPIVQDLIVIIVVIIIEC